MGSNEFIFVAGWVYNDVMEQDFFKIFYILSLRSRHVHVVYAVVSRGLRGVQRSIFFKSGEGNRMYTDDAFV